MEDKIYVPALVENWQTVYDFLEKIMEDKGISKVHKMPMLFASEEIYVNISNYAYPESEGNVSIHLEHNSDSNILKIRFVDDGISFDPTKVTQPDTTESVEKREVGGLGIFIVNKIMDGMKYSRERGQNNLVIFKKID